MSGVQPPSRAARHGQGVRAVWLELSKAKEQQHVITWIGPLIGWQERWRRFWLSLWSPEPPLDLTAAQGSLKTSESPQSHQTALGGHRCRPRRAHVQPGSWGRCWERVLPLGNGLPLTPRCPLSVAALGQGHRCRCQPTDRRGQGVSGASSSFSGSSGTWARPKSGLPWIPHATKQPPWDGSENH